MPATPVHYFGPGATPEQQSAAARAMTSYPYMGFGSTKPKVFNWLMTPQAPPPDYLNTTALKKPEPKMTKGQLMADKTKDAFAIANDRAAARQMRQQQPVMRPPQPQAPQQPQTPSKPDTPTPMPAQQPDPWKAVLDQFTEMFGGMTGGGGGGGGSAGIPTINVTSGIDAGPVYDAAQTAAAQNRLRQLAARPLGFADVLGLPMDDAQRAALNSSYGNAANKAARVLGTDFGRDVSYANAQHQLASEKARASSGVDWGNLGAREYELGLFKDLSDKQRRLSLLDAIGAMFL